VKSALRGWFPVEILHFPWRAPEQVTRKARIQAASTTKMRRPPRGFHASLRGGELERWFLDLAVDEADLEQGVATGLLTVDTRVRDALRSLAGVDVLPASPVFGLPDPRSPLAFPKPSLVEDAAYAVDTAVLAESELLRAQKRLDALEKRIAMLESRPASRVARYATNAARRARSVVLGSMREGSADRSGRAAR
jgi:hypothetical protein